MTKDDEASSTTSPTETTTLIPIKLKSQIASIQLDENNFLLCKYQVETAIRWYGLEDFIKGAAAIQPKMTADKEGKLVSNQDHIMYQRQDSLLTSWLLSYTSVSHLSQIVGCN